MVGVVKKRDGSVIGSGTLSGPLPGGETATITINTIVMTPGTYSIMAAVDQSPNRISELSESNNTRSGTLTICANSKICPQYGWSG